MTRLVKCVKLGIETEGLDSPPFPGEKGQEIYEKISKAAWQAWLSKQTMIINENKLASFDPKARAYLAEERNKFLFEGNDEMPAGYVPPKA
ncbi:MAG: Fe(2+)-trafficking protein [Methylobacter sp.]|uniref:oxidative damage protection protein n=1 Tax=Methylovulum miyakonense TaxID=645578 RepID=UPI0003719DEC|nr:oxidative damage protection protein [Methylovulum miyakonense]PPD42917.1 MAG: Fe(2+)-trafficking protein [Methylobacter sp.]